MKFIKVKVWAKFLKIICGIPLAHDILVFTGIFIKQLIIEISEDNEEYDSFKNDHIY